MLGAPEEHSPRDKAFHRVQISGDHFAIRSFSYLALAEWNPIETPYGVRIARPEMMALAGNRDETLGICNRGLLSSMEAGWDAFLAIGQRIIQQVIESLESK